MELKPKEKKTRVKKSQPADPQPATPIQQWTAGGAEVLVVRFCDLAGKSHGGFQHPITVGEIVTAPDWKPDNKCGGGIHGWAWGHALGDGKDLDWSALWQVYGVLPEDIAYGEPELTGKLKFRTGTLRCVGAWDKCLTFVNKGLVAWTKHAASGASSATGYGGASSATGIRGVSSATGPGGVSSATGYGGVSSATGIRGASSATGYGGVSSATGPGGASSATGDSGASSATGIRGAAVVTGLNGKAMGGELGCIALAYQREDGQVEMVCAQTGKGKALKALVWYTLDASGQLIELF